MAQQSVEPQIADLAHGWLKQYKLEYHIEQDAPNDEIKNALLEYESKQGGSGGNRPDCNLLLKDNKGNWWPVLIEYKGYKDRLVKLDSEGQVANRNAKGQPEYKNISQYAVNGAAGQSVFHCHMHLIPRYKGDVENPKGGVRGVIPNKQKY